MIKTPRPVGLVPLLLAAALACLALAPSAGASFGGRPGPIAYSISRADETVATGGIYLHGPRSSDKPRQLTDVESDSSPSFSPDGRTIVFVSMRGVAPSGYSRHLFLINADGSGIRQLTSGEVYDSNPSFSPDGRTIVFDRTIGSSRTPHIFTIESDGSGERQLTSGRKADYEPSFTANGAGLVFVSNRRSDREKNRSAIFTMRLDGSGIRVLIDTPRNEGEPDVSPKGRIVFMSNRDGGLNIYTASAAGRRVKLLLKPVPSCVHRSCYSDPVWSPDEKHIAARRSSTYSSSVVVLRSDGRGFGKTFVEGGTEEEGYGTRLGPPAWGVAAP